ncbi:MAG: FtsW/RodA/SpoVE family cell cycle protein, partial [Raoultibacter sp.]
MAQVPTINSVKAPDKTVVDATKPRRFKYLNLPFLVVIALLVGYGLLIVYTAVFDQVDYSFTKQLSFVVVGVVAMAIIWRFDYRRLSDFTVILLIINVVLILSPHLPVFGVEAKGAQSWLMVAGQQVQPGEFAKLTVILLAASVMARYGGKLDDPREYLKALGIMLIPFFCIMTQPDLGTGLVYLFITAVAFVIGGVRAKYLIITLLVGIVAIAAVFALDEVLKTPLADGSGYD